MSVTDTRKSTRSHRALILLIICVLVAFGAFGYFSLQYVSLQNNSEDAKVREAQTLASQVEMLIDVPKNEIPLLITIEDVTLYRTEPIFARVEVGDRILVYPVAGKIIIYRPKDNLIVDAASLDFTLPTVATDIATTSEQATTTPEDMEEPEPVAEEVKDDEVPSTDAESDE